MTTTETLERDARTLGAERGRGAATWILDGNSSEADARYVLQSFEDPGSTDLEVPAPLSGEFAGDPVPRDILEELGVDEESDDVDDILTAYEDGFYQAYADEASAEAQRFLGLRVDLSVCVDCLIIDANGADGMDIDDDRLAEIAEGFAKVNADGWRYANACPEDCEGSFSWSSCDLCGTRLGGDRHPAVLYRTTPEGDPS